MASSFCQLLAYFAIAIFVVFDIEDEQRQNEREVKLKNLESRIHTCRRYDVVKQTQFLLEKWNILLERVECDEQFATLEEIKSKTDGVRENRAFLIVSCIS